MNFLIEKKQVAVSVPAFSDTAIRSSVSDGTVDPRHTQTLYGCIDLNRHDQAFETPRLCFPIMSNLADKERRRVAEIDVNG
jgi:hypothetical protein